MKWLRCVLAIASLAVASPASAHPVPFSYLDVRVTPGAPGGPGGPGGVDATLVAHVADLGHEIGSLEIAADGRTLHGAWSGAETTADPQSRRFQIRTAGRRPASRCARCCFRRPSHRHSSTSTKTEHSAHSRFSTAAARSSNISPAPAPSIAAVVRSSLAGIHHILIGRITCCSCRTALLGVWRDRERRPRSPAHSVTAPSRCSASSARRRGNHRNRLARSIVYVGVDNLMVRGRRASPWIAAVVRVHSRLRLRERAADMDLPARARLSRSSRSTPASSSVSCSSSSPSRRCSRRSLAERHSGKAGLRGSLAVIAAGAILVRQRVFLSWSIS